MKFLVDHCVSMRTIHFLRNENFSLTTLKDLNKHKLPDSQVLSLAINREEILITEDKGFGNILNYPLYTHNGIILLITKTKKREVLHTSLNRFLSEITPDEINGKLIIIEDNLIRIRQ